MSLRAFFLGVTLLAGCSGDDPAPSAPREETPTLDDAEKARVLQFWETFRRAQSLRREGRWTEAVDEYRKALELDPDHEGALYGLANSYIELGRFDAALEPLAHLVEVDPLAQRGHLQIGLIRSCPDAGAAYDLDAAERALQRAFEINQEETGALLRLAEVKLLKGEVERAFELYTLANRSNFRAVEGYYVRAYLRWRAGRVDEATELLAEAVRQSHVPKVVAGAVPGEGDTRPGSELPPSKMGELRLLGRVWKGLEDRFPDERIEPDALDAEFAALDAELRAVVR